jgi:hypothetical protein
MAIKCQLSTIAAIIMLTGFTVLDILDKIEGGE